MQQEPSKKQSSEPVSPTLEQERSEGGTEPLVISAQKAHRLLLRGKLPPGCTVEGSLTFLKAASISIPPHTHIQGSLLMLWMRVELGEGLSAGGDVDLSLSSVDHLPPGMTVGGNLILIGTTSLKEFPDDLRVGGLILLDQSATEKMREQAAEANKSFLAKYPCYQGVADPNNAVRKRAGKPKRVPRSAAGRSNNRP